MILPKPRTEGTAAHPAAPYTGILSKLYDGLPAARNGVRVRADCTCQSYETMRQSSTCGEQPSISRRDKRESRRSRTRGRSCTRHVPPCLTARLFALKGHDN